MIMDYLEILCIPALEAGIQRRIYFTNRLNIRFRRRRRRRNTRCL